MLKSLLLFCALKNGHDSVTTATFVPATSGIAGTAPPPSLLMKSQLHIEPNFVSEDIAEWLYEEILKTAVPGQRDSFDPNLIGINGDAGTELENMDDMERVIKFHDILQSDANQEEEEEEEEAVVEATKDEEERTSGILRIEYLKEVDYERTQELINNVVENRVLQEEGTIHMYLSLPDSSALANHTDTTDIFVLQLHGAKEWILCSKDEILFPYQEDFDLKGKMDGCSTYNDIEMSGLVCHKKTLYPGDALYLPKRVVHSARATHGGLSAHLTFGLADNTCLTEHPLDCFASKETVRSLQSTCNYGYSCDYGCDSGCNGCCSSSYYCDCHCDSSCDSSCDSGCPASSPTSSSSYSSSYSYYYLSGGAIAGIVIGCLVFCCFCCGGGYWILRRSKRRGGDDGNQGLVGDATHGTSTVQKVGTAMGSPPPSPSVGTAATKSTTIQHNDDGTVDVTQESGDTIRFPNLQMANSYCKDAGLIDMTRTDNVEAPLTTKPGTGREMSIQHNGDGTVDVTQENGDVLRFPNLEMANSYCNIKATATALTGSNSIPEEVMTKTGTGRDMSILTGSSSIPEEVMSKSGTVGEMSIQHNGDGTVDVTQENGDILKFPNLEMANSYCKEAGLNMNAAVETCDL